MQRTPYERLALALGQIAHRGQRLARSHPLLDQAFEALVGPDPLAQLNRWRLCGSANRIAHNLVEPAAEMFDLAAVLKRGERVQKRLLDDVLGASIGALSAGEGE